MNVEGLSIDIVLKYGDITGLELTNVTPLDLELGAEAVFKITKVERRTVER